MEIDIAGIISQLIAFGVVLFVLAKFVYKPVLKILDERAKKIKEGLDAAEKSVTELSKIEEKKQVELIKAQKQAAQILTQARDDAQKMSKSIVAQAREDAEKAVKSQQATLEARFKKEEIRLKGEIASLVSATTQTILKGALTPAQQTDIINREIKRLKTAKRA